MLDSQTLTEERFARQVERQIRSSGAGATDGAISIIERYLEETKGNLMVIFDAFATARTKGKTLLKDTHYQGIPKDVFMLDPYKVALCALHTGISSVGRTDTLSQSLYALGAALEAEVYAYFMVNWDAIKAERIRKEVSKRGSVSARKTAMKSIASKMGFAKEAWPGKDRLKAGQWLLDTLITGSVFVLGGEADDEWHYLTMTEEALGVSDRLVRRLLLQNPALLPSVEPLAPWSGSTTHIHGYKVPLVRSHQKAVHAAISADIKSGRMNPVLDALNAIQDTPWRINASILDMVQWAYQEGVQVPGLPHKDDLELPIVTDEAWGSMTDDQRRVARRERSAIKQRNRGFIGERRVFETDIATADQLKDGVFYTPVNMDYRGRVYGLTSFNFQRQDYVRALFQFSEGKPLDDEGRYWLKVHLANCGDFDKVSKRPFDERVAWVDDKEWSLTSVALNPKSNLWWTEADAPFLFLAACQALYATPNAAPCCIPVSFDGTCSGLQHLAAMTRDEETAYHVNLTPVESPKDVYSVVAGIAESAIQADLDDPEKACVANLCLKYGVGRSLVKRNVMTYSYSSQRYGMGEQHMEDTMEPLRYEVMSGQRNIHPFLHPYDTFTTKDGVEITVPGRTASRYLAHRVYDAITKVVRRPADAMGFLQDIAKALSHEGKPVVWHTPLGLPVVLRYTNHTSNQISLFLHDRGVTIRHQAKIQEEGTGIDKARASNAIAPGFVHSMDACHLQMVVLAAKEAGISSIALVHDSFGCLPNDAGRFRKIINGEFVKLYSRDVLSNILEEAKVQMDDDSRLPALPQYGKLNIEDVLQAEYAFA